MTCLVRIGGGFGNQLFQYCLGRTLQLDRGLDVVYETSFYQDPAWTSFDHHKHHKLWLTEIGLPMRTIALSQFRFHTLRRLHRLPPAIQKALLGVAIVREKLPYMSLPAALDGCLINGVWANPRYFGAHSDLIRREIVAAVGGPRPIATADGGETVAFHVRRGDYLHHHSLVNLDYRAHLEAAREALAAKLGARRLTFVVFSNDMAWCREAFADCDVVLSDGVGMLDDFRMMLGCRHHVIANSTFSWWAAWLGDGAEKVVIAPRKWVGNQSGREIGLVLPDWLELDR